MATAAVLMAGCGSSAPWTAARLRDAILPGNAPPAAFRMQSDSASNGGAYDLKREQADMPAGALRDALAKDGFAAGYQRNWIGGEAAPAVAYVDLFAFRDGVGAADFLHALVAFLGAHGQDGSPAPHMGSGALVYTTSGPGGHGYSVLAVRDRVVMQLVIGGGGAGMALARKLAAQQLSRL